GGWRGVQERMGGGTEAGYGERAGERAAELAGHFERGGDARRAVVYRRRAGEQAMARAAYREAVGSFEQALSALQHLPGTRDTCEQAIDLRFALRSALRPLGASERILRYLHEAGAIAEVLGDPRRLGQIAGFLSIHFRLMGAPEQAIAAAQRALMLATAHGDVVLQALANQYLGTAYEHQGDYRRA